MKLHKNKMKMRSFVLICYPDIFRSENLTAFFQEIIACIYFNIVCKDSLRSASRLFEMKH